MTDLEALEKKLGVGKPSPILDSHPEIPFAKGDRVRLTGSSRMTGVVRYVRAPSSLAPWGLVMVNWDREPGQPPDTIRHAGQIEKAA